MKQKRWWMMVMALAGLMLWSAQGWAATRGMSRHPAAARATATAKDESGKQGDAAFLHGGTLSMAGGHAFETVFGPDGVRVYLYTAEKTPAMVEGATGKVTLNFPDGPPKEVPLVMEVPPEGEPAVYFCPMHKDVVQMQPGVCEKCGGMKLYKQNRLFGQADLSLVKGGEVTAQFQLTGVEGDKKEVAFGAAYEPAGGSPVGATQMKPLPKMGKGMMHPLPKTQAHEQVPPAGQGQGK